MRVRVVYFATARDAAGRKGELIQLDGAPTLRHLTESIHELHPALRLTEVSTRYSVNLEIADDDCSLHDGDEVGVLPAVTGG